MQRSMCWGMLSLAAVLAWPMTTVGAVYPSEVLDFEDTPRDDPAAASNKEVFQNPQYSGSTRGIVPNVTGADFNSAYRSTLLGGSSGVASCEVYFTWAAAADPYAWVRLTSNATANRPNPSVHTQGKIRFNIANLGDPFLVQGAVGLCVAVRETGVQVPQLWNGQSTGPIEIVGVSTALSVIEMGTNGVLDTTVAGDDVHVTWTAGTSTLHAINWGPDRILQSTPAGDDVANYGYVRAATGTLGAFVPVPAVTIPVEFGSPFNAFEVNLVNGDVTYNGVTTDAGIVGFTGNGTLADAPNSRGTLEALIVTPVTSDPQLSINFFVDDLQVEAPAADPIVPPMVQSLIIDGDTQVTVSGLVPYVNQVTLYADLGQVAQETVTPGTTQVTLTILPATAGQGYTATQRDTASQISGYSSPPIVVASGPPPYSFSILVDEGGGGSCSTATGWEYVGASSVAGWIPQGTTFLLPRDGLWQTIDIPLNDPAVVKASPVGNGTLAYPSASGYYTMDTLWFTIAPNATSNGLGPWEVLIDAVQTIDENGLVTGTILNMEDAVNRLPSARGQSTELPDTSVNTSAASYDGVRSHRLAWTYDTPAASQSLGILQRTSGCGTSALIPDSTKKVRFHMVCRGLRTAPTIALPQITGPVVGSQTGVQVTNDATATAIQLYVDELPVGSPVTPTGTTTDITGLTLTMGQSVSATQTLPAGTSDLAYPRFVGTPLAPTVQGALMPGMTTVTVVSVLTTAHATASTVTVYVNDVLAGTAAGGTASVVVSVAALANGQVVKATQTVNGVESPKSAGVTVAVPAPVVQTPLGAGDTQVTVTGLQATSTTATVYVNAITYPVATGGAASVVVTVPALASGDVVKATQTMAGVEGPFSNTVVIANFVKINEFNYDDASTDNYQFIELHNSGASPVNISGWVIQIGDVAVYYTVTVPASTTIAAGGYWVVGQTAVAGVPGAVVNVINDALNLGDSGWGGAGNAVNGEMYIALRNPGLVMLDAVATEMNKRITPGPAPATPDIVAQIGVGIWGNHVNPDTPVTDLTSQSRFLDGLDTDNNGRDWGISKASPGTSNNQPDLMPYSQNANALVPPAAVPNWVYSYVAMRAKDPTVADTVNPAAIPASPDGGNVMIAWDESGGGDCVYLSQLAKENFTLETYIYIPPTYSPVGFGYEDARIGIRGSADGVINLGDPGGMTGLEWFWQRGESWQILYLLDENDGDDTGLPGYSYARMIGSIAIAQNDPLTTGWQRLLLESQGDKVRGIFGGTYGSRGDGIKKSGTHQSTGPGGVFVGYRETMTLTGIPNNRPPTLDAFTLKAPPVDGDMDGDGDVDLTDLAKFVNCMNGPNVSTPPGGCTLNEFGLADLSWDNDVDMVDFAEFQVIY